MAGRFRNLNPWRGLGGLPREVWILSLATLVNKMGTMVLAFLVLYLTRSLHFTDAAAANVLLIYGAAALVGALGGGFLCDRWGPIRIMRASMFLSGTILLLYPFARGIPLVILCTLALSVTAEAFRPAILAIFGDLLRPDQRKTGFALNRLAINLGMSVGPAMGGFLAKVSFFWLFVVNGASALSAGTILALTRVPGHHETADTREIHAAVLPLAPARRGYRDTRLILFLAGVFPVAVILFQHIASMSVYLVRDMHFSEATYGLLFTLNCLLIVLLEVPLNVATSHWPHRWTLTIGALLFGAGFGGLAIAWNVWTVAATVVVWTFGEMFFFPGMAAYLTDIAPADRRGEYMGLSQMVMGLAFMVGPWGGLLVLARFGAKVLWSATFLVGLVAAAMIARIEEPAHRQAVASVPQPTTLGSAEP